MRANANRKYSTDEPLARVSLHVPADLAHKIDNVRGQESRNAWIVRACQAEIERLSRE